MNKLHIIASLMMFFTGMQAQITDMIIYETGGNTVTYQIANIDSIVYRTAPITTCGVTFTDSRDGEVYPIVQIGNQCWMAENLRYNAAGSSLHPTYPSIYGRFYDWATVMNGSGSSSSSPSGVQGICPSGWHVPSDAEWSTLEIALGMSPSDSTTGAFRGTHGAGMKSTTDWSGSIGTNSSGFNAFPTGYYLGNFYDFGTTTVLTSSTEEVSPYVWNRTLSYQGGQVGRYHNNKTQGISCRCVKN